MSIVKIENVRVLDPIKKTDRVQTVFIEKGKLVAETDQVSESLIDKNQIFPYQA